MTTVTAIQRRSFFLCTLFTLTAACDHPVAPGTGYLRVLVTTRGLDQDDSFEISSDTISAVVPANMLSLITVPQGPHLVQLEGVANNCSVEGNSEASVGVEKNDTVAVNFIVNCAAAGNIVFVESGWRLIRMTRDNSLSVFVTSGSSPSWSPDGTKVVYSRQLCDYYYYKCKGRIEIIDMVSRRITPLTLIADGVEPAWSRNGDAVAYRQPESGFLYLYSIANFTNVRIPVGNNDLVFEPSWSPNGNQLVASCNTSGIGRRICIFDRDGSNLRYVTDGHSPALSSDGTRIVFTMYPSGASSSPSIAVINADGTGLRTLADGSDPEWSPDGTQVVFAGTAGLFLINADGSGLKRLTSGAHTSPAWR